MNSQIADIDKVGLGNSQKVFGILQIGPGFSRPPDQKPGVDREIVFFSPPYPLGHSMS